VVCSGNTLGGSYRGIALFFTGHLAVEVDGVADDGDGDADDCPIFNGSMNSRFQAFPSRSGIVRRLR
jgi:hypothetical protein